MKGKEKEYRQVVKFVADFETTVDPNTTEQKSTEVWSSAITKIGNKDPEKVMVWNNIDGMFNYLFELKSDNWLYFHNLSFDGSFILNWLLRKDDWKQAYDTIVDDKGNKTFIWRTAKEMENNTFSYTISDRGQWYNIVMKVNDKFIKIYDSLKLLPFSVKAIGEAFKTEHQKLTMDYVGLRYAGGVISDEELAYIKNDVLVMSEALDIMFKQGHTGKTIGSCCLKDYKNRLSHRWFTEYFPDLRQIIVPEELRLTPKQYHADSFIRKSYKGGWCYLVKGKENKIYENGITADVNSLYPSVMHSISGNFYPIREPNFWVGENLPEVIVYKDNNEKEKMPIDKAFLMNGKYDKYYGYYYFIRIKTEFKLKKGYLPCIQIKDNGFYKSTEWLERSDIWIDPYTDKKGIEHKGHWSNAYIDVDRKTKFTQVTLTLTCTDYELIKEHYHLYNTEIIGGCYFIAECGIFDDYIDEWRKVKENSTGAMRTLAKLFLNNLYGKLASSDDSSFKVAHLDDEGVLSYEYQEAHDKDVVSIACGSAVTSYARNFTIQHAQKNFYGKNKRGFIYADTDSIHCDLTAGELVDINAHPTEFLAWKLESTWDKAIFVRQKTYIEHVIEENLEPIEAPYHNITCAGMGKRCKELLNYSFEGITELDEMTDEEEKFLSVKRSYKDFKQGLKIPSKLVARNIAGGVLLSETTYEMH